MKVEEFTDVDYSVQGPVAWIVMNRPHRYNAFTAHTVDELIAAFRAAWSDTSVGAVVLTGAGEKAFCTGGDQKQKAETGDYGPSETGMLEVEQLQRIIRQITKPVIAAVNGFAIGGGHVLHVICDLTIASSTAKFGQTGPRVGSFDAGFGTAYLARVVGEKRARQIWFMLDQFDAETAERWGLVNLVVPPEELRATAQAWGERVSALSPTALKVLKHSFNADSEHIVGLSNLAYDGLELFTSTDESHEGVAAFNEKRTPDFGKFR
jgi:2-ketocyclohexanecarboxyl-CoA hydrolase